MHQQLSSADLTIFESELYRTTSSLIMGEGYLLLIDPNWLKGEVDFIYEYVAKRKKDLKCYLLFTHSDFDHIIGYRKFPGFTTIASRKFVDLKNKEEQLEKIRDFDATHYIQRDYEIAYPRIDIIIEKEGEALTLGEDEYRFYLAPGHTADGLITHNVSKGIVIAGDYLSNIEFPFIYDSVSNYKNTLKTFAELFEQHQVNFMVCGHGDHTTDRKEMQRRVASGISYIAALERAVQSGQDFDLSNQIAEYPLAMSMAVEHKENIKLAQIAAFSNQ